MSQSESFKWAVQARVKKWANPEDARAGKEPDEVVEAEGNALLNVGIERMLNLLGGRGGTPFDNTNGEIGVGNGQTSVDSEQTDLQGTSTFWSGMEGGYPVVSGRTITFRATYDDNQANFPWEEWAIRNGSAASEVLNRRVVSLGTKAGGLWSLEVDITVT